MNIKFIDSITKISEKQWDNLFQTDYPFIRHKFLRILEESGSVSEVMGWKANHLVVLEDDALVAALPCYLKFNSYGEYVFDFQWANAYQRAGLNYYPKLLTAIPFSPVTGLRIGIDNSCNKNIFYKLLPKALSEYIKNENLSSWHINFLEENESNELKELGYHQRISVQFYWYNRKYNSFNEFLNTFKSRHRKNLLKERKKINDQEIHLIRVEGVDLNEEQRGVFYYFYQLTYIKRSGHTGYLTESFFDLLFKKMPENIMMVFAYKNKKIVAAALNLKDSSVLYGRYWGCAEEYDFLHFETCYYQGIEYCIEKKLSRFDSGAQGEHKIQRGFEPCFTYSNHYLDDERFSVAVGDFLREERGHVSSYLKQAAQLLPYKKTNYL